MGLPLWDSGGEAWRHAQRPELGQSSASFSVQWLPPLGGGWGQAKVHRHTQAHPVAQAVRNLVFFLHAVAASSGQVMGAEVLRHAQWLESGWSSVAFSAQRQWWGSTEVCRHTHRPDQGWSSGASSVQCLLCTVVVVVGRKGRQACPAAEQGWGLVFLQVAVARDAEVLRHTQQH